MPPAPACPASTVAARRNAAPDDRVPAALAAALLPSGDPWSRLETKDGKSAERLLEIIQGNAPGR